MDLIRNSKPFAVILALVVLAGAAYLLLRDKREGDSLLTSTGAAGPSQTSRELLATLGDLKTVQLSTTLFADPLFASLQDFGVEIPLQPKGRRNPFAPLGDTPSPKVPAQAPQR